MRVSDLVGIYQFPRAAVTNYHKLGGLKQKKSMLSLNSEG